MLMYLYTPDMASERSTDCVIFVCHGKMCSYSTCDLAHLQDIPSAHVLYWVVSDRNCIYIQVNLAIMNLAIVNTYKKELAFIIIAELIACRLHRFYRNI